MNKLRHCHYILHMFSQYVELRPTSSWDRLVGLGHPSKFQRVSRLGFVTAPTSMNEGQPNFAWCLAVSWAGTLYIHFRGILPLNGILQGAIFTLRPCLAFSYIGSVTARHSSSGRQTLRRSVEGATYIRHGSHHVGHILVQQRHLCTDLLAGMNRRCCCWCAGKMHRSVIAAVILYCSSVMCRAQPATGNTLLSFQGPTDLWN